MAVLYVTEFDAPFIDLSKGMPMVFGPKLAVNNVAIGAGSVASAAFGANTKIIRVHTDAICSIAVGGAAPVATASDARMAANQTEYFYVKAGDKIAVITNT